MAIKRGHTFHLFFSKNRIRNMCFTASLSYNPIMWETATKYLMFWENPKNRFSHSGRLGQQGLSYEFKQSD